MTWMAIVLAAAALAFALRWGVTRVDVLGRVRPFPYMRVGLLAVLAVAVLIPGYLRHREEKSLSAVATSLVGAPAAVRCQSFGQELVDLGSELGYVRYGADGRLEHRTMIKHAPCKALNAYRHSDKHHPTDDEVVAVHVLTHESMHMRGLVDEATAECAAVQHDELTARLLGADEADARELARRYWLLDYPQMPDDYRSGDCRPGGAMDEQLASAPWAASG